MNRTARHLSVISLVVALAASACSAGGGWAARVNGVEISHEAVVGELEAIEGNDAYVQSVLGTIDAIAGRGAGTFDSTFVVRVLTRQIIFALATQELDERDLDVPDAAREAARRQIVLELGQGIEEEGQRLLDGFPTAYTDGLVEVNANLLVLQGALVGQGPVTDDAVREFYDANSERFEQVCSRHILVETPDEAEAALADIAAGTSFTDVAAGVSLDGSADDGGDLGCQTREFFVEEFSEAAFAAEVGVPTGPVESPFGFHVILVESKAVQPFEEARGQAQVMLTRDLEVAFGEWLDGALTDADVDIDQRYGTWDGVFLQVVPPEAPTTTLPPLGDEVP